jgi:hypothetical protein
MKKDLPNVTLITVDCRNIRQVKAAADICEKDFNFGAVKILSSIKDDDPRVVPIEEINNGLVYSMFYIKELWKYVDTPLALTFHSDAFILNPSAWEDEFLEYDYLGPPWQHPSSPLIGGNGGFAIRSRRLLEYVGKNYEKIGGHYEPEDLWVCETARAYLEKEGMRFAPRELALRWGIEGNERGVVWNGQFGWHNNRSTDISKWLDAHPEYKEIFTFRFTDFAQFMRRYPVYDGTWHVLSCKPIQVGHYKELVSGKNYDCRLDLDLSRLDPVKPGHKIIYRLWRILLEQVGVPTFERQVEKVEKFSSKQELLKAYPHIKITPSFSLPKWKQRLVSLLGNTAFPDNQPYTLFWFKDK